MKRIVVYNSSTGFTKTYAEWIAQELNRNADEQCKLISMKSLGGISLEEYDEVIYGGWIMGGMITGLDKIKKKNPQKLVIFAVGSSPKTEQGEAKIKEQNHLEDIPLFYLEGGFRFEQLNFFIRMMLKIMKKSIAKKENKTETDLYMEKTLGTSFDHSDRNTIGTLIEYVNRER